MPPPGIPRLLTGGPGLRFLWGAESSPQAALIPGY